MKNLKVGDEVAFAKMCQPGMPPFTVTEVVTDLFGTRVRLNIRDRCLWSEACFMPYSEWKNRRTSK